MNRSPENVRFCRLQLDRFSGLEYYSTLSDAALRELGNALLSAPAQAVAELAVSTWLMEHKERPTPADIYGLIRTLGTAQAAVLPAPCDKCERMSGRVLREYVVEQGVFAGEVRTLATECDCALGQALKAGFDRQKAADFSNIANDQRRRAPVTDMVSSGSMRQMLDEAAGKGRPM